MNLEKGKRYRLEVKGASVSLFKVSTDDTGRRSFYPETFLSRSDDEVFRFEFVDYVRVPAEYENIFALSILYNDQEYQCQLPKMYMAVLKEDADVLLTGELVGSEN